MAPHTDTARQALLTRAARESQARRIASTLIAAVPVETARQMAAVIDDPELAALVAAMLTPPQEVQP
jgi:hypothetical protein